MASNAGMIFDEHGGDAMEIAELLMRAEEQNERLRARVAELEAGEVEYVVWYASGAVIRVATLADALLYTDRAGIKQRRVGPWVPVDENAEVARVRGGHGMDTPPRPGGLLGPLPRRSDGDEEARGA